MSTKSGEEAECRDDKGMPSRRPGGCVTDDLTAANHIEALLGVPAGTPRYLGELELN